VKIVCTMHKMAYLSTVYKYKHVIDGDRDRKIDRLIIYIMAPKFEYATEGDVGPFKVWA
jgi:hypothetical protein